MQYKLCRIALHPQPALYQPESMTTRSCFCVMKFLFFYMRIIIFLVSALCLFIQAGVAEELQPGQEKIITLEQAIEMALAQNRYLQGVRLDVTASHFSLDAQDAEFDIKVRPAVGVGQSSDNTNSWNMGVDVSKKMESNITVSLRPTIEVNEDENITGLAVSLGVPLLRGFGKEVARDSMYSSIFAFDTAKLNFYRAQVDTVLQAVSAVYNALQSEQLVTFFAEQAGRLEGHLALVKIKVESGVVSTIDLYRAKIRLQEVRDSLTSAQELYANSIDILKEILAMPMRQSITITAPVAFEPVAISLEESLQTAQLNRVEIEQQQMSLNEAGRKEKLAKHNLLPSVNLEMAYSPQGRVSESFDFTSINDQNWFVRLSGDTDFSRTVERSAYERSRIAFRQAKLNYEATLDRVEKEVRSQLNRLEKSQHRIELRKEQIRQAEGKLSLAQSKFRYGMAGNFDLLEAQTEFQKGQVDLLSDVTGYIVGTYQLRSILGTLLSRELNR